MDKPPVLPAFYNPKEMGRSLKEVATDIIQTESQGVVSRWLHSQHDIDLFIWQDEQHNIIKQQLSFHGQIAEWNLIEGIRTGVIYEDETQGGPAGPSAELIRYDEDLQKGTILQALELIRFIEALPEAEREQLIENFKKDPSLGNLSPELFLKKYKKQEIRSSVGFFRRIASRIGRWFK